MTFNNIKNRLILGISLFITILLVVIATATYAYFRHTTQQLIFDQQFTMITDRAHDLDHEITTAHKALVNVANVFPAESLDSSEAIEKWLTSRAGIRTYFTSNLSILDPAGILIASAPTNPEKYGMSSAERDYFKNTMSTGQPSISAPYVTRSTGHPVIVMTAPLRAEDGSIKGLLCGSIDLLEENGIFGALRDIRLGQAGYLYLFALDRTMIMHPDPSLIMKHDVKPGVNQLLDMALAGFEGSGETTDSKDLRVLASFKRLQSTDWILAAHYPVAEAYQQINRFKNFYLLGMFVVLLVVVALGWMLHRAIAASEQTLQAGRDYFKSLLINNTTGILVVTSERIIVEVNPQCCSMFGYESPELLGQSVEIIHLDREHFEGFSKWFKEAILGTSTIVQLEYPWRHKDGSVFWCLISGMKSQLTDRKNGVVWSLTDITDRKQTEDTLRQSEEKFRAIADHIYDWEYWQGVDGSLVYCSSSCERITGYTAAEFSQDPKLLIKILHPDEVDKFIHHLDFETNSVLPKDCQKQEFRIYTRSGKGSWISHICQEVFDREGKSMGRRACNRDITERKRAEEELLAFQESLELRVATRTVELRESEKKYHILFMDSPDAYLIISKGIFIDCNQTCAKMLGCDRSQIIGIPPELLSPEFQHDGRKSSESAAEKIKDALRIGHNKFDWTHRRFDGSEFLVEVSIVVIPLDGKSALLVTWRDITLRKQIENIIKNQNRDLEQRVSERTKSLEDANNELTYINQELEQRRLEIEAAQETLLQLSSAVKNSPAGIIITDCHGKIEYINPKFIETTGYLAAEVLGQTPRILNSGTHPQELYHELWSTILDGREWRGDLCNRKKNGDLYWEHSSISPIKDKQGKITHFVAIKEDVTEQKRQAEELLLATDAAQAANRAKSDFLANMSHEIRTPLNAIIGFSALTLDSSLPPVQHDYIQKVNTAGALLLSLINDILDFSKIEAGQLAMEQIPFRLETTISTVTSVLQQKAFDKGLKLLVETAPGIPSCLLGDPHRLGQIILNLLGNAIKFTEQGEVTLLTSLSKQEDKQLQLKFTVRDTGIGFSAAHSKKLFQPFSQADGSTTRRFGGTGLGLSISKQLVELMAGEIWCESTPGQGSSFCFTAWFGLCEEKDLEQCRSQNTIKPKDKGLPFDFSGVRILLVEDNQINQQLAIALLQQTGAVLDLAANGKEAVTMITSGSTSYNLVLMDIQMPVMDGYEATRLIREDSRFATLPIIAMTAHTMQDELQKINQAGMVAIITKPIVVQTMLRTMATFLHKQEAASFAPESTAVRCKAAPAFPENIVGLEIEAAVNRLGGDRNLYLVMLSFFIRDCATAGTGIKEALLARDTELAARKAHTIKGIAGTIGAEELAKLAKSLENAIVSGEATATDTAFAPFNTELDQLIKALSNLPITAPPPENSTLPCALDLAVVTPILNQLLTYLSVRDGKAESYLDAYQSELAGLPQPAMRQINRYLKNFNFADAEDAIRSLSAKHGIMLRPTNNKKEFYS